MILRQEAASCIGHSFPTITVNRDENRWIKTIDRWYIGPARALEKNSSVLNRISNLHLSMRSSTLLQNSYLNNVTHLAMDRLNNELLGLLMTHVNCSRIKHLNLGSVREKNDLISSLLSLVGNIESLRIRLEQLCSIRSENPRQYHSVQLLDLSIDIHSFNEKDISIISRMFPHLEHLIIHREDLAYVLLLQIYLPRLRSLSYIDPVFTRDYSYGHQTRIVRYSIQTATRFSF